MGAAFRFFEKGLFSLLGLTAAAFIVLSVTLFSLNFEGSNDFKPYTSDRFQLPFPRLFDEFELDGKNPIKSQATITRGKPEVCYRRVAPEYETFVATSSDHLEYVTHKKFVVGGDMPPGWMSYTAVDSALILILDGCRLDYVLHDPLLKPGDTREGHVNRLKVFHEYMDNEKLRNKSRLFQFTAPIPTLTVYSLKTAVTGETRRGRLVTQTNNVMELEIDNAGMQLHKNMEKTCVLGDETFAYFIGKENLTISHTGVGADVFDMEKPDCYVFQHYGELFDACDTSVLHMLAIDHLGHSGNAFTPTMRYYLDEYDNFIRKLLERFHKKKNRMLFSFGDHGQKNNGSHGGHSRDEVDSFFFVHSDMELTEHNDDTCDINNDPSGYARYHNVLNGKASLSYPLNKSAHLNLAIMLTLLKNKPIPFHSEGLLIRNIIPLMKDAKGNVDKELSLKYVAQMYHINSHRLMRALDTTISYEEKSKYTRLYSAVQRRRRVLAPFYSYIRSMGPKQMKYEERMKLYEAYIQHCEKFMVAAKKLFTVTNKTMTPEYMVSAFLFVAFAILLLIYQYLAFWRKYHAAHITENEESLFEGMKFKSTIMILVRPVGEILVAVGLAFSFCKHIEYVDKVNLHRKLLGRDYDMSIFKKIILVFQRILSVEEEIFWFQCVCYALIIFFIFIVLDSPFLLRSYLFLFKEGQKIEEQREHPLPEGKYERRVEELFSMLPLWMLPWLILLLYIIASIMIITSQCAIVSHDIITRHTLVVTLYLALLPFFKRTWSLKPYSLYFNMGMVFFILKASYIIHPFLERRDIGKMIDKWYMDVQELMKTFEMAATCLTVYYVMLMWYLSYISRPSKNAEITTPSHALKTSRINYKLVCAFFTLEYLSLLSHYAFKAEQHIFLDGFVKELASNLSGIGNYKAARVFLGVFTARLSGAIIGLVWLTLVFNPREVIYATKGSPYHRSTSLFLVIANVLFFSVLVSGPKKAIGACILPVMLYNVVSLLFKARIRNKVICFIIFIYMSDFLYFVIGHSDSPTDLDWDAAFLFVDKYIEVPSGGTVFLSFCMTNTISFSALCYLFYLNAERRFLSLQTLGDCASEKGENAKVGSYSEERMGKVMKSTVCMASIG
ncbi:phosphatidylinositol glycan like protein [Babesia gibsoni]|uniref:Phosphatidylinositol glycan like protein n=1 Tax=Babesia gibsoni TaxID=33632 RepID=A0AAD8LGH4_BABGI|nr:phosphatidylinositol glycan like protein [Babesia gibsoni]